MLPMPAPSRRDRRPVPPAGCSATSPVTHLVGAGVPDGPLHRLSLCLWRPHFFRQRKGKVPRLRARVTFGRSPKSDQKGCLKPQVSRLPARLQNLFCGNAFLALQARWQQRLNVELTFFYPRCRSCGKMQRCRVLHFRVKAAALREIRQFNISDEPERGITRRKEIQKPWVFGGVLSPISFAAERNGAAGGMKKKS